MNKVFQKVGLEQNRKNWLGWEGKVLVSGEGSSGGYVGRNFAYRPIIVKSRENLLGKTIKVRIKEVTYYDLRGVII